MEKTTDATAVALRFGTQMQKRGNGIGSKATCSERTTSARRVKTAQKRWLCSQKVRQSLLTPASAEARQGHRLEAIVRRECYGQREKEAKNGQVC